MGATPDNTPDPAAPKGGAVDHTSAHLRAAARFIRLHNITGVRLLEERALFLEELADNIVDYTAPVTAPSWPEYLPEVLRTEADSLALHLREFSTPRDAALLRAAADEIDRLRSGMAEAFEKNWFAFWDQMSGEHDGMDHHELFVRMVGDVLAGRPIPGYE